MGREPADWYSRWRDAARRELGLRLASLRRERRFSLGDVEVLSAQLGERINKTSLFRFERGMSIPSLTRLVVLSRVLRVKLLTLMETLESAIDEHGVPDCGEGPAPGESFESLRERGLAAARGGSLAVAARLLRAACRVAAAELVGSVLQAETGTGLAEPVGSNARGVADTGSAVAAGSGTRAGTCAVSSARPQAIEPRGTSERTPDASPTRRPKPSSSSDPSGADRLVRAEPLATAVDAPSNGTGRSDSRVRLALARHDLAVVLRSAGRFDLARHEAEEALETPDLPARLRDRLIVTLASVHSRLGQGYLARELLGGLLHRKEDIAPDTHAAALEEMGTALFGSDPAQASAHFRAALTLARKRHSPAEYCRLLIEAGAAESRAGLHTRALKRLTEARDLCLRRQLGYLAARAASEIGKAFYFKGDLRSASTALHEANHLARVGVYYDRLFINHFYQRRLALREGDPASARAAESSLRFFARQVDDGLPELAAFRREAAPGPRESGVGQAAQGALPSGR